VPTAKEMRAGREGWPSATKRNPSLTVHVLLPLLLPADYRFFLITTPVSNVPIPPLHSAFPTLNHSASASLETIPRAHCKDRSLLVLSPSPHNSTGSLVHHPSSTPISPRELVANRHLTTAGLTLALPIESILLATHPPSTNATPHCEHLDNKYHAFCYPSPSMHLLFVARSYLQGRLSSICVSMIRVCLALLKLTTHPQRPASAPVVSCQIFTSGGHVLDA
jgi:hypothetical protein